MDKVNLLKMMPATELRLQKGSEIFRQGSPSDAIYIIESGEVSITRELSEGRSKPLAVFSTSSVFGESAIFSELPRTASARALTDCVLLRISKSDFAQFIAGDPVSGINIISQLLRSSLQRLEETSRELATIYETGKIIASANNLNSMSEAVLAELSYAVEYDGARLYIYNNFNDDFESSGSPALEAADSLADGSITATAFEHKDAASILISPVKKNSVCLGFLVVWSSVKDNFTKSHQLLLSAVCGQLADAIENIKHQQEERDRARLNSGKENYGN